MSYTKVIAKDFYLLPKLCMSVYSNVYICMSVYRNVYICMSVYNVYMILLCCRRVGMLHDFAQYNIIIKFIIIKVFLLILFSCSVYFDQCLVLYWGRD